MPMTWDAIAEASLLKCFLKVHNITPRNADIAKEMQALGYDCSASAVSHRFHEMKKAGKSNPDGSAAIASNDDDAAPNTPTKPKTPRKPRAKTSATPRATKRKVNKGEEFIGTADSDDEEVNKSSPKFKKSKTESEDESDLTLVKKEA